MANNKEIIRSRAPLRISFAGGGTDVSPYSDDKGGVVLNATINRYAYVTIVPRDNKEIEIASLDYDVTLKYSIDKEIAFDGQLDLIKGIIRNFKLSYDLKQGFKIFVHSDAPPGSGLGSSSAVAVAVILAFAEFLRIPITPYDLANVAYKIERIDVGLKGGKQDQYASSFGGVNFIEFYKDKVIVNPLRLRDSILNELEYSLVLGYIGSTRSSGKIIERQISNYKQSKECTIIALDNIKKLVYKMKNYLLQGELRSFGRLLNDEWEEKKKMAKGISNEQIDEIYREARKAGALGGKISGAGGGGFMFFYTDFDKKVNVVKQLKKMGIQVLPFSFTNSGAVAWRLRSV